MGKAKAKKPTRSQKKIITAAGLVAKHWHVLLETEEVLHLVNKTSGKPRMIHKEGRI